MEKKSDNFGYNRNGAIYIGSSDDEDEELKGLKIIPEGKNNHRKTAKMTAEKPPSDSYTLMQGVLSTRTNNSPVSPPSFLAAAQAKQSGFQYYKPEAKRVGQHSSRTQYKQDDSEPADASEPYDDDTKKFNP